MRPSLFRIWWTIPLVSGTVGSLGKLVRRNSLKANSARWHAPSLLDDRVDDPGGISLCNDAQVASIPRLTAGCQRSTNSHFPRSRTLWRKHRVATDRKSVV